MAQDFVARQVGDFQQCAADASLSVAGKTGLVRRRPEDCDRQARRIAAGVARRPVEPCNGVSVDEGRVGAGKPAIAEFDDALQRVIVGVDAQRDDCRSSPGLAPESAE